MGGYKCGSIGCYSYQSPETNVLFQKLQTVTNQFLPALGMPLLKVDGIIGRGTTESVLVVLISIAETDSGTLGAAARSIEASIGTPEVLAANAQVVVDTLVLATKQGAMAKQVVAAAPLPAPTPEPTTAQKLTTTANAPSSSSSPQVQAKLNAVQTMKPALATSLVDRVPPWAAYVGGAALVVGAIGVAFASMAKKRRGKSSGPSPAAAVQGWLR